MAKVVEQEMSENVGNLNTYIKDTTDIPQKLNNISQPQPNETIMFCLDAKVLYRSVPRIEAKSACKTAFENRTTKTISTDSVLEMMDLVTIILDLITSILYKLMAQLLAPIWE